MIPTGPLFRDELELNAFFGGEVLMRRRLNLLFS